VIRTDQLDPLARAANIGRNVWPLPQQASRRGDRSYLPHQQSAAELSGAPQHRADAADAHGALQFEDRERTLDALRWGLVPLSAKDLKFGARCINARAETLATTPAVRDAFKARRCLFPESGSYEWKKTGGAKQPCAIVPNDDPLFAFAGQPRYRQPLHARSRPRKRPRAREQRWDFSHSTARGAARRHRCQT
jgi:hypothetical protein